MISDLLFGIMAGCLYIVDSRCTNFFFDCEVSLQEAKGMSFENKNALDPGLLVNVSYIFPGKIYPHTFVCQHCIGVKSTHTKLYVNIALG